MVDAVKNDFLSRVPSYFPRLGNGATTLNTDRASLNTHPTHTLTQFPSERLCRALSKQAIFVPLVIATLPIRATLLVDENSLSCALRVRVDECYGDVATSNLRGNNSR